MAPPALKRRRYALEHAALRAASAVLPRLPLALVRGLAAAAGALTWAVDSRGRRVMAENLRVALGDTHSAAERRRIARRNYRVFARTFCELFQGARLRESTWDRRFVFRYESPEAEAVERAGQCIFATAHFSNFEWLSLGRALRRGPSMIIAQDFKNPPLTDIFRAMRSHGGQMIISQEGAMLRLFKHLKKGGSAAALVDLNVPPEQSATIIRCFGKLTCISLLHVALAARTGRPIVPALAVPLPDGRYELRFCHPIRVSADADYQAVAQACWDVFEPVFRAHPEHWMWLYKHWRYLPEDAATDEYPAYANPSKRFNRLRRAIGGVPARSTSAAVPPAPAAPDPPPPAR